MRVYALLLLSLLAGAQVAHSEWTFVNGTPAATCQRKDAFDPYVYHAPLVIGINVEDGSLNDWSPYPELEWAPINHFCEGSGQEAWPLDAGGWNSPPVDSGDWVRFKAAWGYCEDWPVLYLLVEWTDDEFVSVPEPAWNTADGLQLLVNEALYDYEGPVSESAVSESGAGTRGYAAYMDSACGLRVSGPVYRELPMPVVPDQEPYSLGAFYQVSDRKAYLEWQVQLFESYDEYRPWWITPGASCLAATFYASDVDSRDSSLTYLTWGLANREGGEEDARVGFSTIGFEQEYDVVFSTGCVSAGSPMSLSGSRHHFGDVQVGSTATWTFQVSSRSVQGLGEVGISSGNAAFGVSPATFTVERKGDSQEIEVTFAPTSPGEWRSFLDMQTENPYQQKVSVRVEGTGVPVGPVSVSEGQEDAARPEGFAALSAHPNPFNASVVIGYQAPEGSARIRVYDLLGQQVAQLLDAPSVGGYHTLSWDGTNADGHPLSSGVYVCVLECEGSTQSHRLVLLR